MQTLQPKFEGSIYSCGDIESVQGSTGPRNILLKDSFPLRFSDKPSAEVFECLLVKVDDTFRLFKIINKSELTIRTNDSNYCIEGRNDFKKIVIIYSIESINSFYINLYLFQTNKITKFLK